MSHARYGQGVERVGDLIYSVGGEDDSERGYTAAVEAYDPASNTWIKKADLPQPGVHLKTVVYNHFLYVIAGYDPLTGTPVPVQFYDPDKDQWTIVPDVVCDIYDPAVTVWNGRILVSGGYQASGTTLDTVFTFDPATGKRETVAVMPTPRFGHTAAVVNDSLMVAGGAPNAFGAVRPMSSVVSYDFASKTWSPQASMATPRMHPSSAVFGGQWFILGGGRQEVLGEVYNPGQNAWIPIPASDLGNRNQPGVTSLGDSSLVLIGGYRDTALATVESISWMVR
ncbi:Kelch repeat-containing protein [Paenibacillus sp. S-38]|uniref:Kelch repeat-containing protein n=1 Tax=Paenibacillus sp. S-38 TaxID=3416710 RepID=UPI003CF070BE